MNRIVLAYAGDLDTATAIPWLAEHYHASIVTVTLDFGRGRDLEDVRDRALATGAVRAHVLDVRDGFALDFMLRALKAGVLGGDGRCLTAASLERSLVAQKLVEIAVLEQATTVAHGGDDEKENTPLDLAVGALNPEIRILAPAREWGMTRPDRIDYLRSRGLPVPSDAIDAPPRAAAEYPDEPAYVDITFERGQPTAINGVFMRLVDLVDSLAMMSGAHGVGRADASQSAAWFLLHKAHDELQKLVATESLVRFARTATAEYESVIKHGLWFAPLRRALDGFVDSVQERVNGVVRLKLFEGGCETVQATTHEASDAKKLLVVTR